MDVELARQQWQDGNRRLEEARRDPDAYRRMLAHVEVVVAQLRRRVGQTFTLQELAEAYAGADDWVRDAVDATRAEDDPPAEASVVGDAAFHVYARGATDYAP